MKRPDLFRDGEAFVVSMKELIKRYQAAIRLEISKHTYEQHHCMSCLLCKPIGVAKHQKDYYMELGGVDKHGDAFPTACKMLGCPWMVILGMSCDQFSRTKLGGFETVYNTSDLQIMKARVKQLRNWIKIYMNHMVKLKETNESLRSTPVD